MNKAAAVMHKAQEQTNLLHLEEMLRILPSAIAATKSRIAKLDKIIGDNNGVAKTTRLDDDWSPSGGIGKKVN